MITPGSLISGSAYTKRFSYTFEPLCKGPALMAKYSQEFSLTANCLHHCSGSNPGRGMYDNYKG